MDIERGCLEILFKKIPFQKITLFCLNSIMRHDYSKINRDLYILYANEIFACYSEDEKRNQFEYINQQIENFSESEPNIFQYIISISQKLLIFQGGEIRCKFDELFRWRELSFQLGQDFFTCAFMAGMDMGGMDPIKHFAWLPIIKSDDERLHNILSRGMAENHFHLGGSTKIFELNWVCLMNIIDDRLHDFKKIRHMICIKHMDYAYDAWDFYQECIWAAFYRVLLFSCLKKDDYLKEQLLMMQTEFESGVRIEERVYKIQQIIDHAKFKYGWLVSQGHCLDYTLEKDMINSNDNACRLLAGERRFLYECFRASSSRSFDECEKNIFYRYLNIRTHFRGQLIQVNREVGFKNFQNYQDRKEFFIEGEHLYEQELARLALDASFQDQNILSLEARLCPSTNSRDLEKRLAYYSPSIKGENLTYVLHFPKSCLEKFVEGSPRNYTTRARAFKQTRAIASLLEKGTEMNRYIRGIDACSNEIGCRPEVFGQYYRYLSNLPFSIVGNKHINGTEITIQGNIHTTYHAGEDFLDIVDGLRAIDEAILFCNLKRGSRIGHGLALGIETEDYYKFKNYKLIMPKQDLLDNIVWMLMKANEMGIVVEQKLHNELERHFDNLIEELYKNEFEDHKHISIQDYYKSWLLRGDYPENYRTKSESFEQREKRNPTMRIEKYEFNREIDNGVRMVDKYRNLYFLYHYSGNVRKKGEEKAELKVDRRYSDIVRKLQDGMIHLLCQRGIGIETNPSSNYLIGTIDKYERHPIIRFNSRYLKEKISNMSLNVSINTDDQGVFDTLLENEYALMALALKKAKESNYEYVYDMEDVYEWIDYVRRMGLEQVFRNHGAN